MTSFSVDLSELMRLAGDLRDAATRIAPDAKAATKRGAQNIKTQMQQEAGASRHFAPLARAISYEVTASDAVTEAQIGPDKNRGGALGNIAYFGTSRGGGTVADPDGALQAEAPRYVAALEDAIRRLL